MAEHATKSGSVSPITHEIASSSAMRMTIASSRPSRRARGLLLAAAASPTRIEMKTMLSMPEHDLEAREREQGDQVLGGEQLGHQNSA